MNMKTLTKNRFFRTIGIPFYRMYASSCRNLPAPKVLALSMPKAGTHLLGKLLGTLPEMMFSGLHLDDNHIFPNADVGDWTEKQFDRRLLLRTAGSCQTGQYLTGHFPHTDAVAASLAECEVRPVLILRDPRDVVVSYAHYVSREPRHAHYRYFNNELKTVDEKVMAAIRGFSKSESVPRGLLSIGRLIEDYVPWTLSPGVTVCSFERLVGSSGGGSDQQQTAEVQKISEAVNRPLSGEQVTEISQKVFTRKSRTFRKGQIGDWSNSFTPQHKEAFKEVAGKQLIELGYEANFDW